MDQNRIREQLAASPPAPAPEVSPRGFVFVPGAWAVAGAPAACPAQQWLYQQAYAQAVAAQEPPRPRLDLFSSLN